MKLSVLVLLLLVSLAGAAFLPCNYIEIKALCGLLTGIFSVALVALLTFRSS